MTQIYKNKIFSIIEEQINGNNIVRIDSPNWVNIIPMNDNNEILFIKQFRHGTQEITLEIPGGLIDSSDKSPLQAAKRELIEETGFTSNTWEENGYVLANPAYQNNRCYFFIARNIKKTHEQNLDSDEYISDMFFLPESDVLKMLKKGEITHSIIFAHLSSYFLKNMI